MGVINYFVVFKP